MKGSLLAFVDDLYEDLELWYPKLRLEEAGYAMRLAAPELRTYAGKHGYPAAAEILIRAAGSRGIKDDLENAGAIWTDEPAVIDGNLISSRTPQDLAVFAKAMTDFLGGVDSVPK